MLTIWLYAGWKTCIFCGKNKICIKKFQTFTKNSKFQTPIFHFFLLQNHHNIIFFLLAKSELIYLMSLYLISKKHRKCTFRGKNCESDEKNSKLKMSILFRIQRVKNDSGYVNKLSCFCEPLKSVWLQNILKTNNIQDNDENKNAT